MCGQAGHHMTHSFCADLRPRLRKMGKVNLTASQFVYSSPRANLAIHGNVLTPLQYSPVDCARKSFLQALAEAFIRLFFLNGGGCYLSGEPSIASRAGLDTERSLSINRKNHGGGKETQRGTAGQGSAGS